MMPIQDFSERFSAEVLPKMDSVNAQILQHALNESEYEQSLAIAVSYAKQSGISVMRPLLDELAELFGEEAAEGIAPREIDAQARSLIERLLIDISPGLDGDRVEFLYEFVDAGEYGVTAEITVSMAIAEGIAIDGALIDEFNKRYGAAASEGAKIKNSISPPIIF